MQTAWLGIWPAGPGGRGTSPGGALSPSRRRTFGIGRTIHREPIVARTEAGDDFLSRLEAAGITNYVDDILMF